MNEAKVWKFFAHETDYADIDSAAAIAHLSNALRFPTVSHMDDDETDYSHFEALVGSFSEAYPHVFSAGTVEHIGQSLLITIEGADTALKPALFMGHLDVVSVVPGTEEDWRHGAFDGYVDDAFIWGRGAIDMKDQVVGELEATEYALAHGWQLKRTLLLAFGQDEETNQSGAKAIAHTLAERGIELEFLVDEGDYRIIDGALYGASGTWIMHADLSEKGYADIVLSAKSAGGHSSNPFGGTSLEILSRAISRISDIKWPRKLTPTTRALFEAIAPYASSGTLAARACKAGEDRRLPEAEIVEGCLTDRNLFPLVTTTCSPNVITGSSKSFNVMPQNMTAVINFRMLEGTSVAGVLSACKKAVSGLPVTVELGAGSSEPTGCPKSEGFGLDCVRAAAKRYFSGGDEPLIVASSTQIGATDAANYASICPLCIRFSAFVVDDEEALRGVHGTNERITKRAYLQGIRFFIKLIEMACL